MLNFTPKIPKSTGTPTKLNTLAGFEFNTFNRSTFLQKYLIQLTHLPDLTHRPVLNLTFLAHYHSSQDNKLIRHTYWTKHTDGIEIKYLNLTTTSPHYRTQVTHIPNKPNRPVLNNNFSQSTFLSRYQKISWQTYKTTHTNSVELNNFSWSAFPQRNQT